MGAYEIDKTWALPIVVAIAMAIALVVGLFSGYTGGTVDNVLMFVPAGVFLVLLLGRRFWWLAILVGIAMTGAIEFSQQFIANRVSDPRDLVANALGAIAGAFIALALTAAKAKRIRLASQVRRIA